MKRVIAAVALLGLVGCDSALDRQRTEICRRAVPAVVPNHSKPDILRVGRGATPDSVRVDYRLAGPPEIANKPRWLVCGFEPGANLASLTTEAGPLNGASLYLLKRYYLDGTGPDDATGGKERP